MPGQDKATAQNAKMNEERTFLSKMLEQALEGDGIQVKLLVSDYAKKHKISCHEVLAQFKDGNKRTALHFSCQSTATPNNVDILTTLLSSTWLSQSSTETLVRLKDSEGLTCLMIAAQHPDRRLGYQRVKTLLETGGNKLALARSKAGATSLHYAASVGASKDTIKALYEAGKVALNTNSKQGGTPLHWAAGTSPKKEKEEDFAEALTSLIDDCGADVNAPNDQGMPPLVLAAAANNDKAGTILVKNGADATKILPRNVTVFHMAADLNLIWTLSALLELENIDVQKYVGMKNDQGETPLDLAASEGHIGCVMLLLPNGKNSEEEARAYIQEKQQSAPKKDESYSCSSGPHTPQSAPKSKDDEAKEKANKILESSKDLTEEQKSTALEHKSKGNTHFAKREYKEAIEAYTAAIASDASDATFYSNRSACYNSLKQYEDALEDGYLAKYLRPDWSKAFYRITVAQLAMQDYEDAACSAWEGLQLDTSNDELKTLLQKSVKMGKREHHENLEKKKKEKRDDKMLADLR